MRGGPVGAGRTRPAAAAGRFYPAGAPELARAVDRLLAVARPAASSGELHALVVPHAGYEYSGLVAATAYAAIPRDEPRLRVALLGPSHFVPLAGVAVSGAGAWATPLGAVAVDDDLRGRAVRAGAAVGDRPHDLDHALEVQLPFLQRLDGELLRVLPVAVGSGRVEEAAALVAALAQDALVVVSTDLSHFHDAASARRFDRATADAVVALDDGAISEFDACGAYALRGLLVHARAAGWTCTLLDLRCSADTAGGDDRVVGYGAFAFFSPTGEEGP